MGHCEFSGGGQTVGGLPVLPDSFCRRKAGTLCKAWLHPQLQVTPQGGLAFMHSPVPTNITPSTHVFGRWRVTYPVGR